MCSPRKAIASRIAPFVARVRDNEALNLSIGAIPRGFTQSQGGTELLAVDRCRLFAPLAG
jgi:hypothetical protein